MFAFRFALAAGCSLFLTAVHAQDMPLPALTGPVILTVSGLGGAQYPDGEVQFDLARLQALGTAEITTSSIWTKGPHVYTGVLLHRLTEYLHIDAPVLRLHALNDYALDLPAQGISAEAPMLAYAVDGAMMTVRDKGPVWVIYPYDSSDTFRTDEVFARSVWQLDRVEVLP